MKNSTGRRSADRERGDPMSFSSDLIRGSTETVILAILLDGDNYGYAINRRIFEVSGGRYELKEATLYTAFRRLEDGGYIRSYWGDEQSGARRRYYAVTAEGKSEYARRYAEWEEAKALIEKLLAPPASGTPTYLI